LTAFIFRNSGFHKHPHNQNGKRFVRGKANPSLGRFEGFQFIPVRLYHSRAHYKETAMTRKRGKRYKQPILFKHRHPVTDGFLRFGRCGFDNRT